MPDKAGVVADLVMRAFRAERGCQALVIQCLTSLASATIRGAAGTAVSIFRTDNDPQQLVWLGDRGDERDWAQISPFSGMITQWLDSYLTGPPLGRTLRLVEEYHRRSPMPYQVWIIEIQAPDARGPDVEHDLQAVRADTRLIGSALYRSTGEVPAAVLFLALAWGVTPSGIGFGAARLARARTFGALAMVADLSRFAAPAPAAFPEWIRDEAVTGRRPSPSTRRRFKSVSPWDGEGTRLESRR